MSNTLCPGVMDSHLPYAHWVVMEMSNECLPQIQSITIEISVSLVSVDAVIFVESLEVLMMSSMLCGRS